LYDATIDIIEKDPDRIFSLQEIQDVLIKDVSQKNYQNAKYNEDLFDRKSKKNIKENEIASTQLLNIVRKKFFTQKLKKYKKAKVTKN
jgi:hypothetical protein